MAVSAQTPALISFKSQQKHHLQKICSIRVPPNSLGKELGYHPTTMVLHSISLDPKSETVARFTLILFLTDSIIKKHSNFLGAWPLFHFFQAAKETGALQAAKSKLEKEVEELTWRLQLEKRIRVNTLSIPLCFIKLLFMHGENA